MDIGDLSINLVAAVGAAFVVAGGLIKLVVKGYDKKLDEVAKVASEAASKNDLERIDARVEAMENRHHDSVRELRGEMNGMAGRLVAEFNNKLDPIHTMLSQLVNAMINGKDK